ncbi:hypothetical protein TD95_001173 [Thielaviopsis punctulata]|uniref:Uncharacterized protein n=1 Tax=Thielaviopsis punctulata TaxID=72032 RepID=A0A0F4ZI40_9PEZI|nr:hypothetical protein TD95_001173 [Thielaviopsis punctulata]
MSLTSEFPAKNHQPDKTDPNHHSDSNSNSNPNTQSDPNLHEAKAANPSDNNKQYHQSTPTPSTMADSSPTARKLFFNPARPKPANPTTEMFTDLRKLPPPRTRTPEPAQHDQSRSAQQQLHRRRNHSPDLEDDDGDDEGEEGDDSALLETSISGSGSGELSEGGVHMNDERSLPMSSPSSPGALPVFDWEEFEARYERALREADDKEREMLEEFERLAEYFGVWVSTSATVDNDRATKRLQTRQRFVSLSEKRTAEKQEHHMRRFHDDHFSEAGIAAFSKDFFAKPLEGREQPVEQAQEDFFEQEEVEEEEEEGEDLGYYEDGTRRTLTDDQIRMFRQSELRQLLRHWEKRKALAAKAGVTPVFSVCDPRLDGQAKRQRNDEQSGHAHDDNSDSGEEGEASDSAANAPSTKHTKKKKKSKNKKSGQQQRKEPKPDLRKRTWDVVDVGLDSLEYD